MKRWIRFRMYRFIKFLDSVAVGIVPWSYMIGVVVLGLSLGRFLLSMSVGGSLLDHSCTFVVYVILPLGYLLLAFVAGGTYLHYGNKDATLHQTLGLLCMTLLYYMSLQRDLRIHTMTAVYLLIFLVMAGWINRRYYYPQRHLLFLEHCFREQAHDPQDDWDFF